MLKKSIKIKAPATVANVSCGFDCLGYAIEKPFDIVTISKTNKQNINISVSGIKSETIPINPKNNTAGKTILSILEFLNIKQGFRIHIEKGIPPGSGLGSSAASAVGAAFGINYLLGLPFKKYELIKHCMEGELVSSGTAHADNVAPGLLGGFVLIRSYNPLDLVNIPNPSTLLSINVLPDFTLNTKKARKVLPKKIPIISTIKQMGNISGFISGLYKNDYALISRSMEDLIAEPVRSLLIPGYKIVRDCAMKSGAIGFGISGSGPSVFAFSDNIDRAKVIGKNMVNSFKESGLKSKLFISNINLSPPKIID